MRSGSVAQLLTLIWISTVLAACSLGPGPRAPLALYDLGTRAESSAEPAVRLPFVFVVHEATGPTWLDSGDILYRLEYDEPQRLRHYANSRWAVSPLTLVGERLRAALGARCARAAAVPDLGIPADYRVRVTVEEFAQFFDSPTTSHVVVRLRLVLIKGRDHTFVAQSGFTARIDAPSPDARGGVAALARALEDCSSQAVDWITATVAPAAGAGEVAR